MLRKIVGGTLIWLSRSIGRLAKFDRLDTIDPIPLLSKIQDAIKLYGPPLETESDDDFPDSIKYIFHASPFHDCAIAQDWRTPAEDMRIRFGGNNVKQWETYTPDFFRRV